MLTRCRHFVFAWLLLLVVASVSNTVGAQEAEPAFKHSPNAGQSLATHERELESVLKEFHKLVDQSADRFEKSAKRQVERYESMMEREVRTLTRAGQIDAAAAARDLLDKIKALPITPPDDEGVHFLTTQTLEVPGSDKATKYGVDLQVNVESAGVQYTRQVEAGVKQYQTNVLTARKNYTEALKKVLSTEQRAGRLEAVREIQQAIDAQNKLPEVARPIMPQDVVEVEEGPPAYLGYYVIEYLGGFLEGERVLVRLAKDEGTLCAKFVKTTTTRGYWKTIDIPVTIVSRDEASLVFSHKESQRDDEAIHELMLVEGKPVQGSAYRSKQDFKAKRDASRGSVKVVGSPDADMLGLKDGIYIMEMTYNDRVNNDDVFRIRMEIEFGTICRTHRYSSNNVDKGWDPLGRQFFTVTTHGKELLLEYDRNMFPDWDTVVVFDLTKKGKPVAKEWSDKEDYEAGLKPKMIGELILMTGDKDD